MANKTLYISVAAAIAVAGVAITIWVTTSSAGRADDPRATSAPTAAVTNPGGAGAAVDRVGQPANGGHFEPLSIPEGVTAGVGADIPEGELTQPGVDLGEGDLVIANLFQADASANPFVMLKVDEFTDPLVDDARATAFQTAGATDDGARVVQKVTLRIRQIAGSGNMDAWNFARSVVPVNLHFESMTYIGISGDDCGDPTNPLAGHDTATNDTVQVCFYVFGAVNTPASPLANLMIDVRMAGSTQQLYIQSNKGLDLGLEGAHEADHEDEWWQTDPETGLPKVDPATGQVVPKPGRENDRR